MIEYLNIYYFMLASIRLCILILAAAVRFTFTSYIIGILSFAVLSSGLYRNPSNWLVALYEFVVGRLRTNRTEIYNLIHII